MKVNKKSTLSILIVGGLSFLNVNAVPSQISFGESNSLKVGDSWKAEVTDISLIADKMGKANLLKVEKQIKAKLFTSLFRVDSEKEEKVCLTGLNYLNNGLRLGANKIRSPPVKNIFL